MDEQGLKSMNTLLQTFEQGAHESDDDYQERMEDFDGATLHHRLQEQIEGSINTSQLLSSSSQVLGKYQEFATDELRSTVQKDNVWIPLSYLDDSDVLRAYKTYTDRNGGSLEP